MPSPSPSMSESPSPSEICDTDYRVTVAEVKAIVKVPASTDDSIIESFIKTAHIIVDDNLTNLDGSCQLDECTLSEIELYLAAHFFESRCGRVKSRKLGDGSDTFVTASGIGLELTTYGQTAKILDSCGILAKLDAESKSDKVKPTFIFGAMGK